MNRSSLIHAAALALALCALPPAASPAAAQWTPGPAPSPCWGCFRSTTTGLFECRPVQSGGAHFCAVSDGGRSCTLSGGDCPTPSTPADGAVAEGTLAHVTDEAAREEGAERVEDASGRTLWKARCNGVVLARAYRPEAAAELRRRSAAITL